MYKPKMDVLAGLVFGRLTATTKCEIRGRRRTYWLCHCLCGEDKWVISDALKTGATRSCGCLNDEARRTPKHGGTINAKHTPEYATWHSMKQRCTNPTNRRFNRYGGRGIVVCPQWMNSFPRFLADMGPRPLSTSLDRIDNDGNYSPDNCRWAANILQSRNTSRNRFFTLNGETLCLADWSKRTGIAHATLHHRLKIWSVERALTEPVKT